MTPDEIIDERREQLKNKVDIHVQRKHEEIIKSWRTQLEKDGLSRGTVVVANNVLKSFYKANYVPLILKAPKLWKTREVKVPNNEELTLIITKGCAGTNKERDAAIIMGLAQTGISLEDFLELLTYNKIKEELETGMEPVHLPMVRTKIMKKYDTFLGADAIERFTRYIKKTKPKPDQPLFPLSKRAVQYILQKVSTRVRIKDPHVTPHRLRSFFNTYMTLALVGDKSSTNHLPLIDYWMGHVIPYGGAYLVPPVDLPLDSKTPSQRVLYRKHEYAVSLT